MLYRLDIVLTITKIKFKGENVVIFEISALTIKASCAFHNHLSVRSARSYANRIGVAGLLAAVKTFFRLWPVVSKIALFVRTTLFIYN